MDNDQLKKLFDTASGEYFEEALKPIKRIYIDASIVQDYRLGALMHLITTEAEFEYIKHRLIEYTNRLDEDTLKYFPVLSSLTNDDIDAFIADEAKHRMLCMMSPMTLCYEVILEFCMYALAVNRRHGQRTKLRIIIGANGLELDEMCKQHIFKAFAQPGVSNLVSIESRCFSELSKDEITSFDALFLRDIVAEMEHPVFQKAFADDLLFGDTKIFSYPLLTEEVPPGYTVDHLLNNTKVLFQAYSQFEYVDRGLSGQADDDDEVEDVED